MGWNPGQLQVGLSPCLQAREPGPHLRGRGRTSCSSREDPRPLHAGRPRGNGDPLCSDSASSRDALADAPRSSVCRLPGRPWAQLSGRTKLTIAEPSTFLLTAVSPHPSRLGVSSGLTQHTVEGGDPSWASSFCDGRGGGILEFASHAASVTTAQIRHCSVKPKRAHQRGSRLPQGVRVTTSTEGGAWASVTVTVNAVACHGLALGLAGGLICSMMRLSASCQLLRERLPRRPLWTDLCPGVSCRV